MARSVAPDTGEQPQPQVVLGAVTTGLLNTSAPLTLEAARQALALVPGVSASARRFPIEQVTSPDLYFGLDCRLAARSGAQPRVIGTARARDILTAGHILQGSARVDVLLGVNKRRLPWSHYAARTGVVEAINKADPADLVAGFLFTSPPGPVLDLAMTGAYVRSLLDRAPQIDRQSRLRTGARRLLWAADLREGGAPKSRVEAAEDGTFRVQMSTTPALLPQFVEFCEILALHDWLLAALKNAFERSTRAARQGRNPQDELDPALSYLGHIWNPQAHLPQGLRPLWEELEAQAHLSWEWQSTLTRVRDKVTLLTRKAIEETLAQEVV